MKEKICAVMRALSTVLLVIVVISSLLMVAPKFFGLDIYAVLSGSMEPEYPTGSLIYVKKDIDRENLAVGDDITFWLTDNMPATHRIIEIVYDDEIDSIRYKTKGIANEKADGGDGVLPEKIIGTPVANVPLLGFLAFYIKEPPGLYVAIAAFALLVWLMVIPDLICPKEKKKKKKALTEPVAADAPQESAESPEEKDNN